MVLSLALGLTCAWAPAAGADSVADELLPLLGLYGRGAALTSPWHPSPAGGISLTVHDEDLLRRYVDGTRVVGLSGRVTRVAATLRMPGDTPQWVHAEASGSDNDRSAVGQDNDWASGLSSDNTLSTLAWRREGGRHLLSAGVTWGLSQSRSQSLDVFAFHRSANDSRMNRYFWDLLEPTLGDRITYDIDQPYVRTDIGWAVDVGQDRYGLQASWQRRTTEAIVGHVNDGARDELRGPRSSSLDHELVQRRLSLGLQRQLAATSVLLLAGYSSRDMSVRTHQLEVPRSSSGIVLDIVELGQAQADQHGPDVMLQTAWQSSTSLQLRGSATWSHSWIQGDGAGNTPVLGYSLRTLPISHSGSFSLSGTLTTLAAGLQARLHGSRFGGVVEGLALRSRYRGDTVADAQMEFGLFVAPLNETSAYDLELYRLSATPSVRIAPTTELRLSTVQYVGNLRSAAGHVEPGRQVTHRGGRIHTLSLTYFL